MVQRLLKVEELAHEGEVGRDVRLALLDEVVCLVQAHGLLGHEVRHGHGHRAADASQTVDQDALLAIAGFICNTQSRYLTPA